MTTLLCMSLSSLQPAWEQFAQDGQLAIDLFRRDQHLVIRAAVAGVQSEDLSVTVQDGLVTIRGERRAEASIDRDDWFHQECFWGSFSRSIILPEDVDERGIEASIKQGLLEIRLPILPSKQKIVIRSLDDDASSL